MSEAIIDIRDFSYIYEGFENLAIHDVNLEIKKGEFWGIIGCNKAGKSTLCQAIVGVLPYALGGQWSGKIFVDGEDIEETQGQNVIHTIGIVFQDAESQFTQETVEDEIAFAMCNLGYDPVLMEERVRKVAEDCHLMPLLGRSPFQLSGGQQQRLAVACQLALKPQVIILDESTSQLDPVGRDEVFALVKQLHEEGHTVIMVDHNIEKIAEYAQKVAVMHEGTVKLSGTVEEVFSRKEELNAYQLRVPQVTDAAYAMKDQLEIQELPVKLPRAVEVFKQAMKMG